MNECMWNHLLENMLATQTQKRIGDFFSGGNSAKQENQQLGETDGEKQSVDGNAEKSYEKKNSNWVATKASISLASLPRCKKIDDV